MKRAVAPLVLADLFADGIKPQHILYGCTFDWTTLKKSFPPEHGMPLSQVDHALNECEQVAILRLQIPIQPADWIILTVGVIVSHLRVPDRIAGIQHWYSLGQK